MIVVLRKTTFVALQEIAVSSQALFMPLTTLLMMKTFCKKRARV